MMGLVKNYVNLSFLKIFEYRSRFFFSTIIFTLFSLVTPFLIYLTYQTGSTLNDWNFNQILFLNGFFVLSEAIYRTIFFGLNNIRREVKNGTFEKYLTRPINPLLHVIISSFNPEGLGSIVSGSVLIYLSKQTFNPLLFLIFLIISFSVYFSVHLIINTLAFWFTEVNSLYWGIVRIIEYGKYPMDIFNTTMILLFSTILPLGIITYYPTTFLLKLNTDYTILIMPIMFTIIFFSFSLWLFKKGMKNYTSAGG